MEYVANGELTCGDQTTDRVIFGGALVALPGVSETTLHKNLQDWVDTSPVLEVNGVPLQVVKCSTYPLEEDTCLMKKPDSNTTKPDIDIIDPNNGKDGQSSSSVGQFTLYFGVGGGAVLVVVLLMVIVLIIVVATRRTKKAQYMTDRRYSNQLYVIRVGKGEHIMGIEIFHMIMTS